MLLVVCLGLALASSDVVVVAAIFRALLYLVPLVVLATLYRGRQHVLMKAALAGYSAAALATAAGASRDLASLISLVPACLLALAIVTWSTRPLDTE